MGKMYPPHHDPISLLHHHSRRAFTPAPVKRNGEDKDLPLTFTDCLWERMIGKPKCPPHHSEPPRTKELSVQWKWSWQNLRGERPLIILNDRLSLGKINGGRGREGDHTALQTRTSKITSSKEQKKASKFNFTGAKCFMQFKIIWPFELPAC